MIYFTADTHFGHENIIGYTNRPFANAAHMDNTLIQNWNSRVGPGDNVFHLGDFSMYGPTRWRAVRAILDQLKGAKHLVLGNHDRLKPFKYVECGFQTVHTGLILHQDGMELVLAHDPAIATMIPADQIMICGHVHKLFKRVENVVNVGVDVWGYAPASLDEVLQARGQK